MTPPTLLRAATFYARWGLSVLAWRYVNENKRPAHPWKLLQSVPRSESDVRDWWTRNPSDNVGIVTGRASGVVIIDLDSPEALAWAEHLPSTPWRVQTGRGEQRGYAWPGFAVNNRAHVGGMALDIRGDGGYVAMPPSVHKSGRVYTWLGRPWDHPSLPVYDPSWLPAEPERPRSPAPPPAATPDVACRRAAAWMAKREPAVQGQGGHGHTVRTAWALASWGLPFGDAWSLLVAWNQTCSPPWNEAELREILDGAWRKRA